MHNQKFPRSAKLKIEVVNGRGILAEGHEAARRLWNFARYCAVGHNWKVRRWRGHWPWKLYKDRMPKYPRKFGMDTALRGTEEAAALSDRCFTYIIGELDVAVRSWFSNSKLNPRSRPPRYSLDPRQLTFEVGRNAKPLGNWRYRLTVLGKGIKERHAVVKLLAPPGIRMKQIKLIRIQPDGSGTIVYYINGPECAPGEWIAALDLGIINLAALIFKDGTSILYNGRGLLSKMQWYEKRAAKCKPPGWNGKGDAQSGSSRRCNAYRRKAANVRKLAAHNLTRHIIDECVARRVGKLVIGDLTGIRKGKDHGKRNNQKLHTWPFAEIRRQLEYKAEEAGIDVIAISEAYTSKTCHFCGEIGSRVERGKFVCRGCGVEVNADLNGAANILKKYLLAEGLGVEAVLPGLPSPADSTRGIGKADRLAQIEPTFAARFDLRNWSVVQNRCSGTSSATEISASEDVVVNDSVAMVDSHD